MNDSPLTAAGQPLLSMVGVEKRFDNGTMALSGLNLDIARGSFVSLVGASGCGKTTVMRLAAGLAAPTGGTIRWDRPAAPASKRIGVVFQEPTLMPWSSVLANVELPLAVSGMAKADAADKARVAIASVGLEGFEGAFPRELSGGMRMRVSLARALVTDPELLLLDEPFAALDEITRLKLTNDLSALWRSRGFTVLFVTHSVFESVYLSGRVVVMSARPGRVFQDIPVEGPTERDGAFRMSSSYGDLCARVSAALGEGMLA
jgi:NitT/TauT family transport system ATP-binding protein